MIVLITLALIGAAIAPGSENIYRLIGASILIGFGLAAAPLSYTVPSEIVPRRWRSSEYSPSRAGRAGHWARKS